MVISDSMLGPVKELRPYHMYFKIQSGKSWHNIRDLITPKFLGDFLIYFLHFGTNSVWSPQEISDFDYKSLICNLGNQTHLYDMYFAYPSLIL